MMGVEVSCNTAEEEKRKKKNDVVVWWKGGGKTPWAKRILKVWDWSFCTRKKGGRGLREAGEKSDFGFLSGPSERRKKGEKRLMKRCIHRSVFLTPDEREKREERGGKRANGKISTSYP